MVLGGLLLEEIPDAERKELKLGDNALALRVKHAGEYGKHAAAKNAGVRKGDILVEVDGFSSKASEGEIIGKLLTNHTIGESVKATVLRGDKRIPFSLPMQ